MNVRRASTISDRDPRADLADAIHQGVDELRGLTPMFPSSARTLPSPAAVTPARAPAVTTMHSSSAGAAPTRTPVASRVRTSAPARRLDTAGALALLREAASEGDGRARKALRALAKDEKGPEDDEAPDVEGIKDALRKLIKDPATSEDDRESARRALKELGGDVLEEDEDEGNGKDKGRSMRMRHRAETTDDETGFERSKRELQKTIDDPDASPEQKDAAKKALEALQAHERVQQEADRRDEEHRAVYGRLSADEKRVLAKLDAKPVANKKAIYRGTSVEMPNLSSQAEAKALADELEREMRDMAGGR